MKDYVAMRVAEDILKAVDRISRDESAPYAEIQTKDGAIDLFAINLAQAIQCAGRCGRAQRHLEANGMPQKEVLETVFSRMKELVTP